MSRRIAKCFPGSTGHVFWEEAGRASPFWYDRWVQHGQDSFLVAGKEISQAVLNNILQLEDACASKLDELEQDQCEAST